MNQSILFPDLQEWNEALQAVVFPAQQSGALIECVVSLSRLKQLSHRDDLTAEQALDCFSELRFDLEELAEEAIEDEEFNSLGQVEL